MATQYARAKWWQLYLTLPLLIGLFILDNRLKISPRGHQALQIGIILLVYGLIHLWIKANAKALSEMDRSQYSGRLWVIQIQPDEPEYLENEDRQRLVFQLPDPEIKGMLSDTFEMDVIDAEIFSVNEIAEDSKKE
jgi:hypothetical protein